MFKQLFIYLAALLGSLAFFLVFALVFLNGTDLDCLRQADRTYTCTARTLLFDQVEISERVIEGVVDVGVFDDGCFEGCSYRTEFILADGQTAPLTEVYTDRAPVEKQASELRQLLHNGQTEFDYHRRPSWWVAYLLGGLFVVDVIVLTLLFGREAVRSYFANRDALP